MCKRNGSTPLSSVSNSEEIITMKKPNHNEITVEQFDECNIYCRMLGHDLTFKYCRQTGNGSFCRKIFDCWIDKIDIVQYAKTHFSPDDINKVFHSTVPKMNTLLNLIEKSKKID